MSSTTLLTAPDRATGRRMFVLLAVALALPFIAAIVLIASGWRPAAVPHYGELLPPAAPLALDDLRILAGPQKSALAGRWLLVAFEPDACAEACRQRLDELRRIHVALYKAMPRVKRVLLATTPPAIDQPDLTVAFAGGWQALVTTHPAIYLVDPRGHAVLRYDRENFSPQAMLRDVERLLRYSWTG